MKKPKPHPCELNTELMLRPWEEVARLFREKTGKHMNEKYARMICSQAMKKLRKYAGRDIRAFIPEDK